MSVEITPYFALDERYPGLIGVRVDGDEYETAYVSKHELMGVVRERDELRELVRDLYGLAWPECPSAAEAYLPRIQSLGVEVDG